MEEAEAVTEYDPTSKQIVRIKITMNMSEHGVYYAEAYFTLEQLTRKNYLNTLSKLRDALASAMRARRIPASVYAGRINSALQTIVLRDIQRFQDQRGEIGSYLRKN